MLAHDHGGRGGYGMKHLGKITRALVAAAVITTWPKGQPWRDPGWTATDNLDGDLTARVVVSGAVNVNRRGNYTLKYDVVDGAGNAATTATREVRVR